MDKRARIQYARLTFAKVTGGLEGAAVAAAEGQAISDLATARQVCDRLIAGLEAYLRRLRRLRRRLG